MGLLNIQVGLKHHNKHITMIGLHSVTPKAATNHDLLLNQTASVSVIVYVVVVAAADIALAVAESQTCASS